MKYDTLCRWQSEGDGQWTCSVPLVLHSYSLWDYYICVKTFGSILPIQSKLGLKVIHRQSREIINNVMHYEAKNGLQIPFQKTNEAVVAATILIHHPYGKV
jgi:hypothetical protein